MNSPETSDLSNNRAASHQWLVMYKYYLYAVIALSLIGFVAFLLDIPERLTWFRDDPGLAFRFLVLPVVIDVARIVLFLFAINSLKRIDEKWTRTFHLSINGIAVVVVLLTFAQMFWQSEYAYVVLGIGHVTVIPIGSLVPWNLLYSVFPPGGEGQFSVSQMFSVAINLVALAFAVLWSDRWSRIQDVVPPPILTEVKQNEELRVDSNAPMSVGSWLLTLILISIPLVNIVLLFWWSFSAETPVNKANFAKAALIMSAITILLYLVMVSAFLSLSRGYY